MYLMLDFYPTVHMAKKINDLVAIITKPTDKDLWKSNKSH